jgi:chaperone modulatory protein CbpM
MTGNTDRLLDGCILEEDFEVSLAELCSACEVHAEFIIALVDEGILEPAGRETGDWRFAGVSLRRAQVARRLQRDLGVNLAGAALVLELMDELRRLQARLDRVF